MGKQVALFVQESNRKKSDAKVDIGEKDIPKPGPGEVLVRINLRPVNPSDAYMVNLTYPGFKPQTFPAVPGGEAVGKVVENGPSASRFPIGTRVVAVPWNTYDGDGSWQQYTAVPEDVLIPVPDNVSDESASQFLINPVTAYGFLETLKVPEGEYLLQTAAGSAIGRQLIVMAKLRGVKTINLVRRKEQAQELLDIGADEVIVTSNEDVVARVKEITGRRMAYAAVDCVAGEMTGTVVASTRDHGTVYVYGLLSGPTSTVGAGNLIFRNVHVTGFWMVTWLEQLGDAKAEKLGEVMDLFARGIIVPTSGKKFPLEQANEAIAESWKVAKEGKVFLEG
ncbi:NAD(P)-binding protein [Coccomyxa subellipsoidea C-169]|uniref:NAD(P)-binding protein n=1 Tax=Coccomyxa subellipsoidea (strain C-169) TaxID=574566 RepID=I0YR04_COCSC|nr:NAD(P)-binding protein [Coccomyxa subellipsoidea C-169]EIE20823.1 NAD(P)-binding protein [Coccomyxa subellipsoidea C-169]|eukprot:XP_005645367.1 NAD(P)-binding protein [Coccomyxa subellipsoidea C-169]